MGANLQTFRVSPAEERRRFSNLLEQASAAPGVGRIFAGPCLEISHTMVEWLMRDVVGPPSEVLGTGMLCWDFISGPSRARLSCGPRGQGWEISYTSLSFGSLGEAALLASDLCDAIVAGVAATSPAADTLQKNRVGGAFINPYALIVGQVDVLLEQASHLLEERTKLLSSEGTKEVEVFARKLGPDRQEKLLDLFKLEQRIANLHRSAYLETLLSLEALVSLVYTLLIRGRWRLPLERERLLKESIPYRILNMQTYCGHFVQPPFKESDPLFGEIMQMAEARNRIVHASTSGSVHQHKFSIAGRELVWRPPRHTPPVVSGLATHLVDATNLSVSRARRSILRVVASLAASMEPDMAAAFLIQHRLPWIYFKLVDEDRVELEWGQVAFNQEESLTRVREILRNAAEDDSVSSDISEEEFRPTLNERMFD